MTERRRGLGPLGWRPSGASGLVVTVRGADRERQGRTLAAHEVLETVLGAGYRLGLRRG